MYFYIVECTYVYDIFVFFLVVPLEAAIQPAVNADFLDGGMPVSLTCNVTGKPTPIVTFAELTCGETVCK